MQQSWVDFWNSEKLRLAGNVAAVDSGGGIETLLVGAGEQCHELRVRQAEVVDHGGVVTVEGAENAVGAECDDTVGVLAEVGEEGVRGLAVG